MSDGVDGETGQFLCEVGSIITSVRKFHSSFTKKQHMEGKGTVGQDRSLRNSRGYSITWILLLK